MSVQLLGRIVNTLTGSQVQIGITSVNESAQRATSDPDWTEYRPSGAMYLLNIGHLRFDFHVFFVRSSLFLMSSVQ